MYSKNNKSKSIVFWSVIALATALFSGIASAQPKGQPFGDVQVQLDEQQSQMDQQQSQIDQQQAQIEALLSAVSNDVEFDVDCSAGESINGVLDSVSGSGEEITINITGICSESVIVNHGHIRLIGTSFSDGISSTDVALQASSNAASIYAENLSISSSSSLYGVVCSDGGSIKVVASRFENFGGDAAVAAIFGGECILTNTHLMGPGAGVTLGTNFGVRTREAGVVRVEGGVVESFNAGIRVGSGSNVVLTHNDDFIATRISNNSTGVAVGVNSNLRIVDAVIEGNNTGIGVSTGSSIIIVDRPYLGQLFLNNNSRAGIVLNDGTLIVLPIESSVSITGNGDGGPNSMDIVCVGSVVARGRFFDEDIGAVSTDCPEIMWPIP